MVAGLTGAVVISVYASEFIENTGFLVPRSLPATAVLFSEPDINVPRTSISRRSTAMSPKAMEAEKACNRPVIPLGRKIDAIKDFKGWLVNKTVQEHVPPRLRAPLFTAYERWSNVFSLMSLFKARVWESAGLACLIPKLRRPFEPFFDWVRCKLGLAEDEFMEAPPCNVTLCTNPEIEEREITMERDIPDLEIMNLKVQTKDDCFADMTKVVYGARVLVKSIDDVSCSDPNYEPLCQEAFEEDRVVMEDECTTPR